MNNEVLYLKQEVYRLTGDFSNAATQVFVALNSMEPPDNLNALVETCLSIAHTYEAALDRLLAALQDNPTDVTGEFGRIEKLKMLLQREVNLILTHPRLAA